MTTYEIYYEGKVQGVGFRATILDLARGFDIAGEVKNLADGRVHLLLQGEVEEMEDFLMAIRESSVSGHIYSEQKTEIQTTGLPRLRGFKISR